MFQTTNQIWSYRVQYLHRTSIHKLVEHNLYYHELKIHHKPSITQYVVAIQTRGFQTKI